MILLINDLTAYIVLTYHPEKRCNNVVSDNLVVNAILYFLTRTISSQGGFFVTYWLFAMKRISENGNIKGDYTSENGVRISQVDDLTSESAVSSLLSQSRNTLYSAHASA